MGAKFIESLEDRRLLSCELTTASPAAFALPAAILIPLQTTTPVLTGAAFKGTALPAPSGGDATILTVTITSQDQHGTLRGTLVALHPGERRGTSWTVTGSVAGTSVTLIASVVGTVPRGDPTTLVMTGTVVTSRRSMSIAGRYTTYAGRSIDETGTYTLSR